MLTSSARSWVLVGVLFLGALAPAAAQDTSSYRLGPKDLIEIRVFEVPELNVERRVSENGTISLPLIGEVAVSGLTDPELTEKLRLLLESRYVQRASVEVQLREFRSKPITIIGAVQQPGPLGFSGRWTLLEALAAAGGLTPANAGTIYVIRRAENGLSDQLAIRVDDLLVRADPRANIPIFANDLVNVPASVNVTVYCLGEVSQPGAVVFASTERLTVLSAIARAGGLSPRASKSILVKRNAQSGAQELRVDYRRIVAGKDVDLELRDGDVLVVKESFF